jgi:hypothetical protein
VDLLQRRFRLYAEDCEKLQQKSIELLELLKSKMPEKTGEALEWNFEKATLRRHTAFCIGYVSSILSYTMLYNMVYNRSGKSSCLAGLKTSALKGQNTAILSTTRILLDAPTTRTYS